MNVDEHWQIIGLLAKNEEKKLYKHEPENHPLKMQRHSSLDFELLAMMEPPPPPPPPPIEVMVPQVVVWECRPTYP
jgi:hypothetical protein